ncbi:golgin subfamily A member 2-like [Actinia tenebrosa]|uniref:Golgin subfamily A member 2-like n=1 Tax=Actinia tenebrosa TaxID=6105 RepID=A0A6P8IZH5_ACTTE|nr:golgin subfamily A member 2-like [Actinia tenebrosa]
MADSEREEKLAAARKRLKKFQQKRTPSSSSALKKTHKNTDVLPTNLSFTGSDSSAEVPTGHENTPDESNLNGSSNPTKTVLEDSLQIKDNSSPKEKTFPPVISENHVDRIAPVSNGRNGSTAEKIRQICNQLNGLTNQDFLTNGEDPVINEIEALEAHNHELEETLQSYKRTNEQLNNQVNEQRKQILQFQDQIKRERTELANRQLLEQRSLKEQLEVHIQTIGILVSEKQELQSSLSQLQRKCVNKESENSELTGRLQAVRQKIVELEKNNANLSANLEKYKEDFHHVRQERDKSQTANYTYNKEKEELLQQNEELKVKLDAKVSEYNEFEKSSEELSFKLKQAELIVQQLSTDSNAIATQSLVQQLQQEKTTLEMKLEQISKSLKRYELDNEELRQRHTDEVDHFEQQIRSLKEQIDALEQENKDLENKELTLQETVHSLQTQLANTQDEDAFQIQETSSMAAAHIEKLTQEKQQLIDHLQNEVQKNAKLAKEENRYVHQIHELEINLRRLEEDAADKASLLESVQGDKETISRALKQNKELKEKLEQIEDRFVKLTNDNMELATQIETEKHVSRELAIKLSETAVELEETKDKLSKSDGELTVKTGELDSIQEKLHGTSSEVDSLRTESELSLQRLKEQLAHKDFELSSLREELSTTSEKLDSEQAQLSNYYKQYEQQIQKAQSLYQHLQNAEDTINQLITENKQLRTVLDAHNDTVSGESEDSDSSAEEHYEKDDGKNTGENTQDEHVSSDEEGIQIKRLAPSEVKTTTPNIHPPLERSYINGDTYEGAQDDTTSDEDMDITPPTHDRSPTQMSKYTNREDVIEGLSVSIRQLEMERNQLTNLLNTYKDTHQKDLQKLQEHMQLQLQQQLQQQYRQVQEQFQQTLHEQQQKILLFQEVLQKQKSQIEKQSENEDVSGQAEVNISYEELKVSFNRLQGKFKNLMDEKVNLQEKVHELEHLTDQLSFETETIEEYVTLYQTQRAALKAYYNEREKIITQLSNEKGDMQNKIIQLQALVKQLLDERQVLKQEEYQLHNIVNKRMLAHEHERVIPDYQEGDQILIGTNEVSLNSDLESSSVNLDNSLDSGRESPDQINELDSAYQSSKGDQADGTAQQILQLLEQLGPTEEGTVRGWMSPAVRRRNFLPCRHCSGSRMLEL